MHKTERNMVQQLADAARTFQLQQTGRAPTTVTVVISEDTLVVTLHEALSPAEQALAKSGREPQICGSITSSCFVILSACCGKKSRGSPAGKSVKRPPKSIRAQVVLSMRLRLALQCRCFCWPTA